MRIPIKLNSAGWPRSIGKILRASPDPRRLLDLDLCGTDFAEAVGTIKIGGVFKTTNYGRYPETTRLLAEKRFLSSPVVLDVGASDGSASKSVIEAIEFSRYYVTDRHVEVHVAVSDKRVFVFDSQANPILYVDDLFVAYNDFKGAIWPLGILGRKVFLHAPSSKEGCQRIRLMNPDLIAFEREGVSIQQYDAFTEWKGEKADLIIAANLLNRGYFSDDEIRSMLKNFRAAMKTMGWLAVIENRAAEQSNVFRLDCGRFIVEAQIGRGSDIKALVEGLGS